MTLQEIKKSFFALRNGIVADTLRKAGDPHKMIFGLQIPQLSQLASGIRSRLSGDECAALSRELWSDRDVRESRLLSCYLRPIPGTGAHPASGPDNAASAPDTDQDADMEAALEMCLDTRTAEEADILAFRVLRHETYATRLHGILSEHPEESARRCARSLARFL